MAAARSSMIEVCVFRFAGNRPEYLLLRRVDDEPLYPGLWQYITGSLEEGERAADGALRELREETGFVPVGFWRAPYVHSFYDDRYDAIQAVPLFAAQAAPGQAPRLSAEHDEFLWLSAGEASRKLVWPGQREGLRIVHEEIAGGREAAKYSRIY
ncbi:MAG TPA: NUDIX domain-containing protein [Bacteroidota bacterium]|nr:NUDIX domain-containing protein [Bacteroidota bacterium]